MTEIPILQTRRCLLNPITEKDVPIMRQIFDDGQTKQYLSELQELTCTNSGIKQMLTSFETLSKQDEGLMWGIRKGDDLIGFIAFMDLSCNPTIFYATHPLYRGNGYMKECVSHSVQYIMNSDLCSYVRSEVHKENTISIKLLKSAGFREVGADKEKIYLQKDS